MMLTPCGPRAVPTGGAGVAAPACSWTLTSAAIFFLGGIALRVSFVSYVVVIASRTGSATLRHAAPSLVGPGNRTILVRDGPDAKSRPAGRACRDQAPLVEPVEPRP